MTTTTLPKGPTVTIDGYSIIFNYPEFEEYASAGHRTLDEARDAVAEQIECYSPGWVTVDVVGHNRDGIVTRETVATDPSVDR